MMGTQRQAVNGIELLTEDHRRVEGLLERFQRASGDRDKEHLARRICAEILVHARLEELVLYPLCREAMDIGALIDEAEVEHEGVETLIVKLNDLAVDDEQFDATVKVMGEQLRHHIGEEEEHLFPAVAASGMDLDALGEELATKRRELVDAAESPFGALQLAVNELLGGSRANP